MLSYEKRGIAKQKGEESGKTNIRSDLARMFTHFGGAPLYGLGLLLLDMDEMKRWW